MALSPSFSCCHVSLIYCQYYSGVFGAFIPGNKALASSTVNWDLTTPAQYTYNNAKIDVTGGLAQLHGAYTPGTNWIANDAQNYNWEYRKAVTIDNTANANALTDYQVSLITDTAALVSAGKLQASCNDLRFTDLDGVTSQSYWIESGCNTASTKIWVKVSSIPASATKMVYMYYGNSMASAGASFDNTFTKNFGETGLVGLWHMDEGAGGTIADSSGNNNTGTLMPTYPTNAPTWVGSDGGQWGNRADVKFAAGNALNFNGSTNYVEVPHNNALNITTDLTISAWIYMTANNTNLKVILEKGDNTINGNNYRFRVNSDNKLRFSFNNNGWQTFGANTVLSPNMWYHAVVSATTVSNTVSGTFYLNSSPDGIFTATANTPMLANTQTLNIGYAKAAGFYFPGVIDEARVYNRALSAGEIQKQYLRSKYTTTAPTTSVALEVGPLYPIDNPTIENATAQKYNTISSFTETLAAASTGTIKYQVSNNAGTTWYWWNGSAWTATGGAGYTSANLASEINSHISSFTGTFSGGTHDFKWRAYLNSAGGEQPKLDNIAVTVLDTIPPPNPAAVTGSSQQAGGTPLTDNTWYNFPSPYFSWTAPTDTADTLNGETASGIAGYYVYFGPNAGADPAALGTYQTIANYTAASLVTGTTYYFRIKTKDNDGNITASADTRFTYKYDSAAPPAPASLQANTLQPSSGPFTFNWSAVTDAGTVGQRSELDHYEYKKGSIAGWVQTTATSVSGIFGDTDGSNIFHVRAVDKAGNISAENTVTYQYILNAPSEPLNVTVDNQEKTVNSFTFSWSAPATVYAPAAVAGYRYSVNNIPNANNTTDLGNVLTTGAITAATQQGTNRFYVVAYDSLSRINYSNYGWIDFNVNTTASAPPAPTTMVISDVSDRHKPDHYALALSWKMPDGYDTSTFGHYNIRRTTTAGLTDVQWKALTPVGTATTPAYAEANLVKGTLYYYRVSGVDNAGAEVALSNVVSLAPTGKYIEAPKVVSGPNVVTTATSAVVTWSTDRDCYSKVEYGKDASYGMQNSSLQKVTAHTITLYGLDPGTTYHYRIQSLDPADQKDYNDNLAYSGDITLATQAAPGISDVKISDIRLDSAIITWKTTSSATSTLKYGKSNSYGKELSDSSGSAVTTHTVNLSGLDNSSTYHFKIFGTDTDGNVMQSDDYSFDTLTFPKVSNIKYEQIKGNGTGLKVTWDSNVPVTSTVVYTDSSGKSQEVSKADLVLKHELLTPHLQDNAEYTLMVKGRDAYGNEGSSDYQKIKTDYDTTPPDISGITTETSISGYGISAKSQMIVSWNTDEPATSQVEYSKGVSGDTFNMSTKEDSTLTTSHVVVVSDLDPSSSYYFRVVSKDNSKNEAKSDTNSALTEQARSSIFDLVLKSFESTLGWLFGGGKR